MRLPDFVVIGVPKAGTSALADTLGRRPDVYVYRHGKQRKEPNFFNREANYSRGLEYYSSLFSECRPDQLCGEATPSYIFFPTAMDRLAADIPTVRAIVVLRNPIDRLYSQYCMNRRFSGVRDGLWEAIESNPEYVARSDYHPQLDYARSVLPDEQILVVTYERLFGDDDAEAEWERLANFLQIPNRWPPIETVFVGGGVPPRPAVWAIIGGRFIVRSLRRIFPEGTRTENRLHQGTKRVRRFLGQVGKNRPYPPLSVSDRRRLADIFEPLIEPLPDDIVQNWADDFPARFGDR